MKEGNHWFKIRPDCTKEGNHWFKIRPDCTKEGNHWFKIRPDCMKEGNHWFNSGCFEICIVFFLFILYSTMSRTSIDFGNVSVVQCIVNIIIYVILYRKLINCM